MGGRCKKKVAEELKLYCPGYFNDENTFQTYSRVKAKIAAIAAALDADGEDVPEAQKILEELDRWFLEESAPPNFDSDAEEYAPIRLESGFEALCTVLESNGVTRAAELTVLQFYSRLEYFKKLNAPKKAK